MQPNFTVQSGLDIRLGARRGELSGPTTGQALDYLQGNVVMLPRCYAQDFLLFCYNNPKPCPLIGVSKPGDTSIATLADDMDIRTDIPRYRVFNDGKLVGEQSDIFAQWSDDIVTFVLGCSFTFEDALQRQGLRVRHIEDKCNVPMFKTNISTIPGGVFSGPLVVTMRSYPEHHIADVFDLSAHYPHAHGTPMVPSDEIPVFWACGVTPQAAIEQAKPSLCITHAPGCMLLTDLPSSTVPTIDATLSAFG